MRKVLVVLALASLMAAPAMATQLVNGDFEAAVVSNQFPSWAYVGPADYINDLGHSNTFQPEGYYYARNRKLNGSGTIPERSLTQDVSQAAGTYDLTLTGWAKRYVNNSSNVIQPTWGTVTVQLLADGNVIDSVQYTADDIWHNFSLSGTSAVAGTVTAKVIWNTIGVSTRNADTTQMDGFVLTVVPEPASLILLTLGLPLLRRRHA